MNELSKKNVRVLKDLNIRNYYVCGDLHGMFSILMRHLEEIGFDKTKDKLVCTGDLCDRGWQSKECIHLLKEDWFESVVGNHELMILDSMNNSVNRIYHIENGGSWFYKLSPEEQSEIKTLIESMPFAIEIHHQGKCYGVVHADVLGNDWKCFTTKLNNKKDSPLFGRDVLKHAVWSRDRFRTPVHMVKPVKNVDAVFMGHNISWRPRKKKNLFYIDTGAFLSHKLTVLKITPEDLAGVPVERDLW